MSERIEIPAEKLHEEMLKLRQGKHMDFLRSLTGMDWGEEGLGVVYHLEDTNTRENISGQHSHNQPRKAGTS